MRAKEFIVEYKKFPTEDFEGLKMSMVEKDGQLIVKAIDDWGVNELGYVIFNIGDNDELDPQDLRVEDKYQGQGIAKIMYDYVKTHGYEIHRSYDQTDAGAGFWNKHRGEDVRVWESEESTNVVYHGNQGGIHNKLIAPMWWTESKEDAIMYATQNGADGWVYSAKLTCKNPYVIKPTDETNTLLEKWKQLQQQGYDSIYDESVGDWIPFYSKDIHLVGKPEYQEDEQELSESRGSLFNWIKQQFPTWPDYVLKDFLYQQAKGMRDQAEVEDFLKRNKQDFGQVQWKLEKLPITFDIFTPKTQRMLVSREGGSANPFQVPKDAERHSQQLKMIQQNGVSREPIIVAKLNNGYDLIEGWHRTIQHLQAYPKGYTAPAWVAYGATYQSK